jgi:hypothetical protein
MARGVPLGCCLKCTAPGWATQERTQLERERLDTVSTGDLPVDEEVALDLAEEPLDRRPQHGGLVGDVGVHSVGCDADLSGDAPHRHRASARSNEAVRTSVFAQLFGITNS